MAASSDLIRAYLADLDARQALQHLREWLAGSPGSAMWRSPWRGCAGGGMWCRSRRRGHRAAPDRAGLVMTSTPLCDII
jgi:hypothetical protein